MHNILVLGLGNPLLGDDGAGWRVAEIVQTQLEQVPRARGKTKACGEPTRTIENHKSEIEVDYSSGGGLALMERMIGYDRAIVIDAMNCGADAVGSVRVLALEELPNPAAGHLGSAHETNLRVALEMGRRLGAALPQVHVVGIESPPVYDFSEQLSPPVARAVEDAAARVMALLEE